MTVIAKSPVPGRVKTRLCPPCSPVEAARLAAAALADTLDAVEAAVDAAVSGSTMRRVLLLDGPVPSWVPQGFDVLEQGAGDLGQRLADGFDVLGPGVIIGMDTPHAAPGVVQAVAALRRDVDALGLAMDGGYWAIGLARPERSVFTGIEMSTPHTGSDQLRRMRDLGRPVELLSAARDIDTFADVRAIARSDGRGRVVEISRELVAALD